jgi:hypothetical protein
MCTSRLYSISKKICHICSRSDKSDIPGEPVRKKLSFFFCVNHVSHPTGGVLDFLIPSLITLAVINNLLELYVEPIRSMLGLTSPSYL